MKRTFLSRRNALLSQASSKFGFFALVIVAFAVVVRLLFPNILLEAIAPLFRFSSVVGAQVSNLSSGFSNAAALARERDALANQNVALGAENGALTAKVADLERLLGSEQASAPGITAAVLARPPESPYDTLIIAAGTGAGVRVGDKIAAQGGTPIGVVTAVSTDAARVELFSASGFVNSGWVGSAHAPVELIGQGGGAFSAIVPRAASTSVNESVYLAGISARPIGTVRAARGELSSATVTLEIGALVNFFSIPYVVITHSYLSP